MAATELYANRSSAFGHWLRTVQSAVPWRVADIDGYRPQTDWSRPFIIEHRTNMFLGDDSSGTSSAAALQALAFKIGYGMLVANAFQRRDVWTEQRLWLAWTDASTPVAVFAVAGNYDDRARWTGPSSIGLDMLPFLTTCAKHVPMRTLRCYPDGSLQGEDLSWLMALR